MGSVDELEQELKKVDKELHKVGLEMANLRKKERDLHEKKTSLKDRINKIKSDSLGKIDWGGTHFEWTDEVRRVLKDRFKIESFRPKQLSAINSTLSGQHAIVVMPTGAGKSLCYQVPALVKPGLTLVVSPLVSLMEDQVRSLALKGITAKMMSSSSSKESTNEALNLLKDKDASVRLLYVTPERMAKSKRFMANLQKCYADGRLQRIAIDEVHCCSQWGHDFRPDYKYLGILTKMFPQTPLLGLTATATAHVLTDIQKMLNIPGCLIIKSTFNRPNLFYKVLEKPTSQEECLAILEKLLKYRYKGQSGIIYTHSIKDSEEIASSLHKRGLKVGCYHANMEADTRSRVHMKWHEKTYQAIVATVAFGMGIDKPDVRFVIHHTISKSMENYYQESGRAGRDGERAECIILYRMQDIFKVSTMVFSAIAGVEHLYGMVKYCLNGTLCRRQLIAEHFDEDWGDSDCNKMCDVCCKSSQVVREISLENHYKTLTWIIEHAENSDTKLTAQKLLDAWYLKGPVNLRHSGKVPEFSRAIGEDVIAFLVTENYLLEDFHYTAYSTISYLKKGENYPLADDPNFVLKMSVRKYTSFDLEALAPKDLNSNESLQESESTQSQKKSDTKRKSEANDRSKHKKIKTVVIDSDSDD